MAVVVSVVMFMVMMSVGSAAPCELLFSGHAPMSSSCAAAESSCVCGSRAPRQAVVSDKVLAVVEDRGR